MPLLTKIANDLTTMMKGMVRGGGSGSGMSAAAAVGSRARPKPLMVVATEEPFPVLESDGGGYFSTT